MKREFKSDSKAGEEGPRVKEKGSKRLLCLRDSERLAWLGMGTDGSWRGTRGHGGWSRTHHTRELHGKGDSVIQDEVLPRRRTRTGRVS